MTVRVASVPSSHPYVRHLADPDGAEDVHVLPDPTDPWWPPRMLTADWVDAHSDEFDVMHIHFGFDASDPADLRAMCRRLGRLGKPLMLTVHDLRNPHHRSARLHEEQLAQLIGSASVVATLTPTAALQLAGRYGVDAVVVPHPHIVELDDLRRRQARVRPERAQKDRLVVGLHLKSLRNNMEPLVVEAAIRAVERIPGSVLRVDVHCDVGCPDGDRYDAPLMRRLITASNEDRLELHVHDYFSDRQLFDYLEQLEVSVLPYRFGTHSGWLEACRDLGVAVVAPDCGAYADQGDVFSFRCNEVDGLVPDSCTHAIECALRESPPAPVPWQERLAQRRRLAATHRELYEQMIRATGCASRCDAHRAATRSGPVGRIR